MRVDQRAAHAVPTFTNGGLGHAHHGKGGESVGQVYLDLNQRCVQSLIGPAQYLGVIHRSSVSEDRRVPASAV